MRVTEKFINSRALADINQNLYRYAALNKQLTSGKKYEFPSDNAIVAARTSDLNSRIRELQRYESNVKLAESYSNMYDTTLQEMSTIYTRIKSLTVNANNDSMSYTDRQAIKTELLTIKEHMASIANYQIGGAYIFGGAKSNEAPLDSDCNITLPPDSNIRLKISVGGYEVKYGLSIYDTFVTETGASAFQILDRLANAVGNQDKAGMQQELGVIELIEEKVLSCSSIVGGNQRLLELAANRMESFKVFVTDFLSKESDADLPKVMTDLAMQKTVMDSALKTAAQIIPSTLVDFMK